MVKELKFFLLLSIVYSSCSHAECNLQVTVQFAPYFIQMMQAQLHNRYLKWYETQLCDQYGRKVACLLHQNFSPEMRQFPDNPMMTELETVKCHRNYRVKFIYQIAGLPRISSYTTSVARIQGDATVILPITYPADFGISTPE